MTTTATERKIFNSLEADDFAFFLSMNGYFRRIGERYVAEQGEFTAFENRVRNVVACLDSWKHAEDSETPAFYSRAKFRWVFLKTGKINSYRITSAALLREPDRAFPQREIVYIDTEDGSYENLHDLWIGTRKAAGAWDEGVLEPYNLKAWQKMTNSGLEDFIDDMLK